jgi:hypothetical protein
MELEPEVHAHAHKTGHRRFDLVLALSALALSIGSMVIAIENEGAMRRLVTANSWPCLQISHGNLRDGARLLHFDIYNAGIGPATLEKMVVTYDDQPVRSARELLERCCKVTAQTQLQTVVNAVENHVFAARDALSFLEVPQAGTDEAVWNLLDRERMRLGIQVCYTSVFDEHWTTSLHAPRPARIDACDLLKGEAYEGHLYEPPGR